MRSIIFRAWDKYLKRMAYFDLNTLSSNSVYAPGHWRGIDEKFYDVTENEIMQFTGLTDMNGKEVFEGDVLRCTVKVSGEYGSHEILENRQVIFRLGAFRQVPAFYPDELGWTMKEFDSDPTNWVVIGNRYENPGLTGHISK